MVEMAAQEGQAAPCLIELSCHPSHCTGATYLLWTNMHILDTLCLAFPVRLSELSRKHGLLASQLSLPLVRRAKLGTSIHQPI